MNTKADDLVDYAMAFIAEAEASGVEVSFSLYFPKGQPLQRLDFKRMPLAAALAELLARTLEA